MWIDGTKYYYKLCDKNLIVLRYFADQEAMDKVRVKKVGLNEEHDPKYYMDFRTLVR